MSNPTSARFFRGDPPKKTIFDQTFEDSFRLRESGPPPQFDCNKTYQGGLMKPAHQCHATVSTDFKRGTRVHYSLA